VTDDVTGLQKVKVMTPKCLTFHISEMVRDRRFKLIACRKAYVARLVIVWLSLISRDPYSNNIRLGVVVGINKGCNVLTTRHKRNMYTPYTCILQISCWV